MAKEILKRMAFFPDQYACGYFSDKVCLSLVTDFSCYRFKLDKKNASNEKMYASLLEEGFIRDSTTFYKPSFGKCKKCKAIRIRPEKFSLSKSQRKVFHKNSDVEIKRCEKNENVTDEKVIMLLNYYRHHNPDEYFSVNDIKEILKKLTENFSGSFELEYRIGGKLAAVSVLDEIIIDGKTKALVSKYFFYDLTDEVLKRSLGVYSVLYEIEFCREKNIPFYYLGLYIADCRKMNYKTNYKPYELRLNGNWLPMGDKLDWLDESYEYKFPRCKKNRQYVLVSKDIQLNLLYHAYRQGVFPWFDEDAGQPVIWASPEKRYVIYPEKMHVPKRLLRDMKKSPFTFTMDRCFTKVMEKCREQKREGQDGTWIGEKMIAAYTQLHKRGYAHSVEAWLDGKLAGGFYGVLIGRLFCGESMFTEVSGSSKEAFVHFAKAFAEAGGLLIDCQMYTENMARYGGEEISRAEYKKLLRKAVCGKVSEIII